MNYFLNLKNGQLSINTYRFPDAQVTTQDDLYKSYRKESEEILTASIENELRLVDSAQGWIAVYTGLTGTEDFVFEEEGHNIDGETENDRIENALLIWGADIDQTKISVE